MWPADVTAEPLLVPTLRVVAGLFGLGLLLVLFFARHDLRAGLRGELGQRLLGWLLLAIPFLIALFGGTLIAAILLGLFLTRALLEEGALVLEDGRVEVNRPIDSIEIPQLTEFEDEAA